jgi:hypothetical protein
MRAFHRRTSSFQRSIHAYGYNGAAVVLAGKLWQGFSYPVLLVGTLVFVFTSGSSPERLVAYPLWAGAVAMMVIGMIHALQGGRLRLSDSSG